jgi:hypothetical protein
MGTPKSEPSEHDRSMLWIAFMATCAAIGSCDMAKRTFEHGVKASEESAKGMKEVTDQALTKFQQHLDSQKKLAEGQDKVIETSVRPLVNIPTGNYAIGLTERWSEAKLNELTPLETLRLGKRETRVNSLPVKNFGNGPALGLRAEWTAMSLFQGDIEVAGTVNCDVSEKIAPGSLGAGEATEMYSLPPCIRNRTDLGDESTLQGELVIFYTDANGKEYQTDVTITVTAFGGTSPRHAHIIVEESVVHADCPSCQGTVIAAPEGGPVPTPADPGPLRAPPAPVAPSKPTPPSYQLH